MDRREFLNSSVVAALAASVLGDTTLARAAQAPAAPATPATPAVAPTPRALVIDAYSRHLHWLKTADEVAKAAIEMTAGGVMPTVQADGHVNPANVATELPAFVNTIRKHGLKVRQIRGGGQTAVDASVEALVGTMGQLNVTHYWLGTDNYDLTKPIMPQLDAIKLKVEKFVALNQKHGTTLMYHTRAGSGSVGAVVWDLLYVMKDFDPKYVGLHWDTGHMSHHMSNMWELLMRTAGPYIVGMSWKDRTWEQNLGFRGEGGPFPGPAPLAAAGGAGGGRGGGGAAGGRGGAAAGAPAAGGRAGGAAGAAGAAGAPAGGRGGRGGGDAAPAPAAGGRGGGRGGDGDDAPAAGGRGAAPAGGGRGGGGRGGNLDTVPRPLAGTTFARGGGWTSPYVPMGMGLVNVVRYAEVLRDLNFNGPMELEAEYPNGGAQSGANTITLPRIMVLGNMKRDILTLRAAFKMSNTGLTL